MNTPSIQIQTVSELLDAAANPDLLLTNISGELLREAADALDAQYSIAKFAGGKKLVKDIQDLRSKARVLGSVSTDGSRRAARSQERLVAIAACNTDDHIFWLLARAVMTPEQLAAVDADFE